MEWIKLNIWFTQGWKKRSFSRLSCDDGDDEKWWKSICSQSESSSSQKDEKLFSSEGDKKDEDEKKNKDEDENKNEEEDDNAKVEFYLKVGKYTKFKYF